MFQFMNGTPHGGPGRPADTTLYDILSVRPTASEAEIKASYKKLAKEFHPDKNPQNGEKFKEISFAYEVLSDERRRRTYDAHGLDGIKGGAGAQPDAEDLLSHIFGGGGGGGGMQFGGGGGGGLGGLFGGGLFGQGGMFGGGGGRRRRGRDTAHPLKVSLEDLYNGKTSKLQLSKQVICPSCSGAGGKSGASQPCRSCKGSGMKVTLRQLGPGMVQQMRGVCPECSGEGAVIAAKDRCQPCAGKKTIQEQKILQIHIEKGMRHNQRITFRGEGDQEPGIEPGDVVIILQEKDHDYFMRDREHLLMKRSITLSEALTGFSFVVKHLDGRDLLICSSPGDVVDPGTWTADALVDGGRPDAGAVRGIQGEGMPVERNPYDFGNLYVQFDVEFPQNHFTSESTFMKMERLLPARKPFVAPRGDDVEEVSLMPYEEHHSHDANHHGGGRGEAYNEDDDEEGGGMPGGARVQCAQQ